MKLIKSVPKNKLNSLIYKGAGLHKIEAAYLKAQSQSNSKLLIDKVLTLLGIKYSITVADLSKIPSHGPVLVVANHPFGGAEGLVLANVLSKIRPDTKIIANSILQDIPEFHDMMYFVDPFGGPTAAASNVQASRQALRWLKKGGLLVVFPAGEVSTWKGPQRSNQDPPWKETLARMIRLSSATVLPVYFHGSNSLLFHLAGLFHPWLRTVLLPRELLNKRGRTVRAAIGFPLSPVTFSNISDQQTTQLIRFKTYSLRHRLQNSLQAQPSVKKSKTGLTVPPTAARTLKNCLKNLKLDKCLVAKGKFEVWIFNNEDAPELVREIGRLREESFRKVGEGTGKAFDLTKHDRHYYHLMLWDKEKETIAGAYRLAQADQVISSLGIKGLYTHQLFKYDARFFSMLGPCLELGRSFIKEEYQKDFAPLLYLWAGIGAFVAKNPQYRYLFGPVSISGEYQQISRNWMVYWLKKYRSWNQLERWVLPRRPFHGSRLDIHSAACLDRLCPSEELANRLIEDLEGKGKGLPVLIRQYLKMGGRFAGFNIDPDFSWVVDGLVVVDLLQAPKAMLNRTMGSENLESFLNFHKQAGEIPFAEDWIASVDIPPYNMERGHQNKAV